jgi:hypothetical protein
MPYLAQNSTFSLADLLGGFFFPIILSFLLPVFLYTLILEKQTKLREMMKLMGMRMSNYVIVTYLMFLLFYYIILIEFVILSLIFQFRYIYGTK